MTLNSVYWCDQYGVPLLREICDICLSQGRRFTSDLKPVFAEERAQILGYLKFYLFNLRFIAGVQYLIRQRRLALAIVKKVLGINNFAR